MDDPIKSAFSRVKQDIDNLENQVLSMKKELSEIKDLLKVLYNNLDSIVSKKLSENPQNYSEKEPSNTPTLQQTFQHQIPTPNIYPTATPTLPQEIGGLKTQDLTISTGNRGVPTDRQTNRQTDQQPENSLFSKAVSDLPNNSISVESGIFEASKILDSLDKIKKDIRNKFKALTNQEMLVFSTIYELEEKSPQNTTYAEIATILGLSESSIRDYTLKLIKKGIPIKKNKLNNQKIVLSISNELKKITTLSTILQLREL